MSDAARAADTCRPTADRSRSGSARWVVQELITEAVMVHEAEAAGIIASSSGAGRRGLTAG